jgi:hypothetical protein
MSLISFSIPYKYSNFVGLQSAAIREVKATIQPVSVMLLFGPMQPENIPPEFDVTVRVGCSLVYEVTGTASLLLNLKLRPDRNQAVLIEALALGDNLPAEEFTDSHGNCVCRVKLAPGTNCFRHDAIVTVSQPDNHNLFPPRRRPAISRPRCCYTPPSRYCD